MFWSPLKGFSKDEDIIESERLERYQYNCCSYDYDEHKPTPDDMLCYRKYSKQYNDLSKFLIHDGWLIHHVGSNDDINVDTLNWINTHQCILLENVCNDHFNIACKTEEVYISWKSFRFELNRSDIDTLISKYNWTLMKIHNDITTIEEWAKDNIVNDYHIYTGTSYYSFCLFSNPNDALLLKMHF